MADGFALTGVSAVPAGGGRAPFSARPSGNAETAGGDGTTAKVAGGTDAVELSSEARKKISELARTDQEVRAHEAAHMAAGGGVVRGGASFSYERGPDGRNYAVAGEVSIDASPVPDNPAATLQKAQQIRAAALAPASPSPQDRKVAAAAGAMASQAAAELARKATGTEGRTGIRLDVMG